MSIERPEKEKLINLYRQMLKIRLVSEKIVELYPEQEMRCPAHLSIGQEAVGTGICEELNSQDAVFSHHRCHAHYLAMGGGIKEMLAELYGRATGCTRGIGGSMHLAAPEKGFIAASSIVGGSIPIAVGAALAFQMRKENKVAVSFFGDGATDEGVFYESLNFAALKNLPVIFVCENNYYAVLSKLEARQKNLNLAEKAISFQIPGISVDGNDVLSVYQAGKEAVDRARRGGGPTLIECRTYRWKEHVGPYCDHDNGHRPVCEVEEWMDKCPVRSFEFFLEKERILSSEKKEEIKKEINSEIDEAVEFAKSSPWPEPENLNRFVYPE